MRSSHVFLAATALATSGVAIAQVRGLNQREVAESQRLHPQLLAEYGGAETGARAAYVESVGRRVAATSGLPSQALRFTALNSPVENAFALPGGYVYVTRQLMALMADEAELAFVLGHETGHIAGRHSQARQSNQRRNSILGVLGAVLGSAVGGDALGNLFSQGAQLRTLSFSRQQEYQADTLGIRYLSAAGYDPLASSSMLAALSRSSALESRVQGRSSRSTPEWAQTHPLSENRMRQAAQAAQRSPLAGTGRRNRDAYLAQVDGVMVDDDPAQGVIDGRTFIHPDLRLQFSVPTGFQMQNGTTAVTIAGTGVGQAQFSTGRFDGNFGSYIQQVVYGLTAGKTQVAMSQIQRTTINGLPAAYSTGRVQAQSGVFDVSVMAYQFDRDTAYHFVMLTRGGQGMQPFASMLDSLRRITPAEASGIRPRVIDVVTVRRGDTVQALAGRMAYRDYRVERFLSLNGIANGAALTPGQQVKVVVYGTRARS